MEKLFNKDITIVAATKMQTVEVINNLVNQGIFVAGENKVQELLEKFDCVDKRISMHFIGQLQTNKVKYLVDKVSMIQSVDRLSLAEEINKQCGKIGKVMPILIEVNIGGESSKGGVSIGHLNELIENISMFNNIVINGLMTIMPINAENDLYEKMQNLYLSTQKKYDKLDMKYLSMGMSNDFEVAIKYGANMIRLGRKLFGERNGKN